MEGVASDGFSRLANQLSLARSISVCSLAVAWPDAQIENE